MERDLINPGCALFTSVEHPEEVFSLLYTAGFRLTGNHREAAGLVEGAAGMAACEGSLYAALKGLSKEFVKKPGKAGDKTLSPGEGPPGCQSGRAKLVQEALLCLPPAERLTVVLRDVLHLTYSEVAWVIGLDEPAVARLLAAGRRFLRDMLVPEVGHRGFSVGNGK